MSENTNSSHNPNTDSSTPEVNQNLNQDLTDKQGEYPTQTYPSYDYHSAAYHTPYQQTQYQQQEYPQNMGVATGTPAVTQEKNPRRFSTPAVAALLVCTALGASLITGTVMDRNTGSSNNLNASNSLSTFTASQAKDKDSALGSTQQPVPEGSVQEVAAKVLPSVVSIKSVGYQGGGEGSGSIISSDGLIITNNHVISSAAQGGKILVQTNDGRQIDADVIGQDPLTDVAVIKAKDVTDLQPIALGDSSQLQVGESVVAVGSPLGLSSTVSQGIVSALNRPMLAGGEGQEQTLMNAIQTDAAMNPGNSGGALVNMKGELIGIPSAIASVGQALGSSGSIGLGFAIPSVQATHIADQLIKDGKATHPMLGVFLDPQSSNGAIVSGVQKGTAAEEAGLKKNDVIRKVDNQNIDTSASLMASIASRAVGDTVTLTVTDEKGDNSRTVDVVLKERPEDQS